MHRIRIALAAGLIAATAIPAIAQDQYPIMDRVADKLIQKYQNSSCQDLAAKRGQRPTGRQAQMEQRAVQMLHQDPQMRQAFIDKVAAPIANKMFECGLIP